MNILSKLKRIIQIRGMIYSDSGSGGGTKQKDQGAHFWGEPASALKGECDRNLFNLLSFLKGDAYAPTPANPVLI